jgi:hypothetical protein
LNQSDQQFANLTRLMGQILVQAAPPIRNVRFGEVTGNQEEPAAGNLAVPIAATLSPLPQTIHTLWIEYEFGIGGRKPAKDFTPSERGKVKCNYHRRKVVWDVITVLVWCGWLADIACDRIYEVYGRQQSATNIISTVG